MRVLSPTTTLSGESSGGLLKKQPIPLVPWHPPHGGMLGGSPPPAEAKCRGRRTPNLECNAWIMGIPLTLGFPKRNVALDVTLQYTRFEKERRKNEPVGFTK